MLTCLALEHMTGHQAHEDKRAGEKLVKKLNEGGFHYCYDFVHLVYADYYIEARGKRTVSHEINGYEIGLPDKDFGTTFFAPGAQIYLDEAQKYFNSRESKSLADRVSRWFELHGHMGFNITLAVQRPKLIDLNIRELATQVIEVVELKHTYDYNRLVRTEWICNVDDNAARAVEYVEGGKAGRFGQRKKFSYEGNIFKRYDSHNFYAAFLDGREEETIFEAATAEKTDYTPTSVKAFNEKHSYVVPDGYYKTKRRTQ